MEKPKFSLFLDFDGTLSDFITIPKLSKLGGFLVGKEDTNTFNPESMEALNMLINTLESKYSVDLVLTTIWRLNMDKCQSVLKNNGLRFDGEIKSIPFIFNKSRLKEIYMYIELNQVDKYLVIDDIPRMSKYFDEDKMIQTGLFGKSLTIPNILNYIDKYLPELSSKVDIPEIEF